MQPSLFERAGGRQFFFELVKRFYAGVADDPVLRPMYPEDLDGAIERLALFLMQYFGGPHEYNDLRGHPRLRMRHFRFPIDQAARDAWMAHMTAAVNESSTDDQVVRELLEYLSSTATFLINRGGLSIAGSPPGDR